MSPALLAMAGAAAGLGLDLAAVRRRGGWASVPVPIATVVALCVAVAVGAATGRPLVAVAAVGLVAAVVLAWAALHRFEVLALALVAARPALDAVQRGDAGGSAPLATAVGLGFAAVGVCWWLAQVAGARAARAVGGDISAHRPSSVTVGLVAFTAAGALSAIGATDVSGSLVEVARLAAGCAMVVVLDRVVDRPSVAARFLAAALAATALPGLVGLTQAATSGGRVNSEGLSRVSGTFAHPNAFALHLAMVLVMAFALLPRVVPRLRPLLLAVVVLDAGLLLLTYSRSGWVAAAAGIAVVGVLQSRRLLVTVVAAAVAAALLVPGVSGRLGDLGDERAVTGGAGNSFVWRLDHWAEAVPLANDNPVTGIGLGMVQERTSTEKVLHNDVLRAYVETGVVGAIAYLGFLGGLVAVARRSLRRAAGLRVDGEDDWRVGAAVGLCGVVAVFIVFSIGGNAITQVVQLWVLAALVAGGAAATRPEPAPALTQDPSPDRVHR